MKPWKLVLIALVRRRVYGRMCSLSCAALQLFGPADSADPYSVVVGMRGCGPQQSIVKSTTVVAPGDRERPTDLDEGGEEVMK